MRDEVPERFHYRHSNRITPIVAIPDPGYIFTTHDQKFKAGGGHGYDNMDEDMRAIFFAAGPKITKSYTPGAIVAPFFNVELYNFMTELLNIEPSVHNGTIEGKFPILDDSNEN
jgi:predicted AlkP superfamily pyrophosphatase or phosphodiesterase